MYYLTIKAKRKNARRHLVEKSYYLDYLESYSRLLNKDYTIEIYERSNRLPWKLIETLNK